MISLIRSYKTKQQAKRTHSQQNDGYQRVKGTSGKEDEGKGGQIHGDDRD